jgi:hypothetical protein
VAERAGGLVLADPWRNTILLRVGPISDALQAVETALALAQ